jgi:predicted  nucleic acid-binding Zn-ribbon protein
MPGIDEFLRLRELGSMLSQASAASEAHEDELNRLRKREATRAETLTILDAFKFEHRTLASRLNDIEHQLSQRLVAETQARLEDEGLALLMRQQEIDRAADEARTFLGGYDKTLTELRVEIDANLAQARLRRDEALARAAALREDLPADWREKFDRVLAKKLAHGPFSRLTNTRCHFCQHAVSKVFESEVDVLLQLKACPGCGRLLLPHKVVAG